jgi:hypothetical protein
MRRAKARHCLAKSTAENAANVTILSASRGQVSWQTWWPAKGADRAFSDMAGGPGPPGLPNLD